MNLKPISRTPHLFPVAVTVLFVGATLSVPAHPGHPLPEEGLSHLVTSPDHLAVLVVVGVLMLAFAQFARRRLPRHWLRFGAAATLIGAAALWGLLV